MTPTETGGLISREIVLEYLRWQLGMKTAKPYGAGYDIALQDVINAIRNHSVIPPEDAEPVRHGRWKGLDCTHYAGMDESGEPTYKPHREYRCSLCGRATVIHENFCPKCGAKMDKGDTRDG